MTPLFHTKDIVYVVSWLWIGCMVVGQPNPRQTVERRVIDGGVQVVKVTIQTNPWKNKPQVIRNPVRKNPPPTTAEKVSTINNPANNRFDSQRTVSESVQSDSRPTVTRLFDFRGTPIIPEPPIIPKNNRPTKQDLTVKQNSLNSSDNATNTRPKITDLSASQTSPPGSQSPFFQTNAQVDSRVVNNPTPSIPIDPRIARFYQMTRYQNDANVNSALPTISGVLQAGPDPTLLNDQMSNSLISQLNPEINNQQNQLFNQVGDYPMTNLGMGGLQNLDNNVNYIGSQLYPQINNMDRQLRQMYPQINNMDRLLGQMNPQINNMDQQLGQMNPQINNMDQQFGQMYPQINNMDQQLGQMYPQINTMDRQLGQMNPQINNMDQQLGQIYPQINTMDQLMGQMDPQINTMNQLIGQTYFRPNMGRSQQSTFLGNLESPTLLNPAPLKPNVLNSSPRNQSDVALGVQTRLERIVQPPGNAVNRIVTDNSSNVADMWRQPGSATSGQPQSMFPPGLGALRNNWSFLMPSTQSLYGNRGNGSSTTQDQFRQIQLQMITRRTYYERSCNAVRTPAGIQQAPVQGLGDPMACNCYPRADCESQLFMYISPQTVRECGTSQTGYVCCCEDPRPFP